MSEKEQTAIIAVHFILVSVAVVGDKSDGDALVTVIVLIT